MKPLTNRVVLKLKIHDTDFEQLEQASELCVKALNAGLWDWLERTVRGREELPQQVGKSEGTKIYHAIRHELSAAGLPMLNSQITSAVANAVKSNVSAKVDWRNRGEGEKQKKRSDEIRSFDQKPPFFTKRQLFLPCSEATVSFDDRLIVKLSHATLDKPRKPNSPLVMEVSTKRMTAGHKKLIRRCIDGDLKLADSKIVLKDPDWYWHLPISMDREPLDIDVQMHLWPMIPPEGIVEGRPFRIAFDSGRDWKVGDGRYLLSQEARFVKVRKEVGWRYRQRNGAGHGRKKIDGKMHKWARRLTNVRDEFRRRLIKDIVRQAEIRGVGTVVYHEPTNPAKNLLWFAESGTDFDWTRFVMDLSNSLARVGATLQKKSLSIKEVRDAA